MKRPPYASLAAVLICCTLLFSACAPRGNMVATLTQLPFAATPATLTPGPTRTPRATSTFTPAPPGYESTSAARTSTHTARQVIFAETNEPTAQAACTPGIYDETVPAPDAPEEFIGKHYQQEKLPPEIQLLDSGSLEEGWNWLHVRVQNQEMYWIQKIACGEDKDEPYWEIADALTLPQLNTEANEVVVDLCFYNMRRLTNIIAYGVYDPSIPAAPVINNVVGWPVRVISAWEMQQRFVPIGARQLTCVQEK